MARLSEKNAGLGGGDPHRALTQGMARLSRKDVATLGLYVYIYIYLYIREYKERRKKRVCVSVQKKGYPASFSLGCLTPC